MWIRGKTTSVGDVERLQEVGHEIGRIARVRLTLLANVLSFAT